MTAVRKPVVAGQFYGGSRRQCLEEIAECMPAEPVGVELPETIVGAIVPHAGWVFSGALAARAFAAVRQVNGDVDTFIVFGAAHGYAGNAPAVYDSGAWETPLGEIEIDGRLAEQIIKLGAKADIAAHRYEHSIEVQVPFIQHLFPQAKLVPAIVPVDGFKADFCRGLGEFLDSQNRRVVCVASTDLTHYGPRYGFCPHGTGPASLQWAGEVNDKAFIDLAVSMQAEKLLEESLRAGNACGPAAAATVVATAAARGRKQGALLGHTTSSEVMMEKFQQHSDESVGYATIVY